MKRRLLTLSALLLAVGPAWAQSPKPISTFKDWTAYTVEEQGGMACYMASQPKASAPDGAKRGQIWALVTQRPYKKVRDEVSITVGYPFEKGSAAQVEIDGKGHELFTDNETAWAPSPDLDAKLVDAMRKGAKLTVIGTSERGTKTVDTYSLSGFAAAHNAILKACNVK